MVLQYNFNIFSTHQVSIISIIIKLKVSRGGMAVYRHFLQYHDTFNELS